MQERNELRELLLGVQAELEKVTTERHRLREGLEEEKIKRAGLEERLVVLESELQASVAVAARVAVEQQQEEERAVLAQSTQTQHSIEDTEEMAMLRMRSRIPSRLIRENKYLNEPFKNPAITEDSIKSLLRKDTLDKWTQSLSIKLGNALEKLCHDIIFKTSRHRESIQDYCPKGMKKRQRDICILDNKYKRLVTLEIKSNLNLDSEKMKITTKKVLKDDYFEKVESSILSVKYLRGHDIPKRILGKYPGVRVLGMNDLLDMFDCDMNMFDSDLDLSNNRFTEEEYKDWVNEIAQTLLSKVDDSMSHHVEDGDVATCHDYEFEQMLLELEELSRA